MCLCFATLREALQCILRVSGEGRGTEPPHLGHSHGDPAVSGSHVLVFECKHFPGVRRCMFAAEGNHPKSDA